MQIVFNYCLIIALIIPISFNAFTQSCTPLFGLYIDSNNDIIAINLDGSDYSNTVIATLSGTINIISAAINLEDDRFHFLTTTANGSVSLYTLNATTGVLLNNNPPILNNISELLYNCNTGQLLGFREAGNAVELINIDWTNGNTTLIYSFGTTGPGSVKKSSAAIKITINEVVAIIEDNTGTNIRSYNINTALEQSFPVSNDIYELEYDENDNELLALQAQGNNIALGSLNMGIFTQIGAAINLPAGSLVGSGTLDPFNNLFYVIGNDANNSLYTLNSNTAVVINTAIAPFSTYELKAAIACSSTVDFEVFNTCDGEEVQFNNLSIGATNFEWDFGDFSGTSTEENPTYVYANTGSYNVTLTVDDCNGGGTFSFSQLIEIVVPPPLDLGNDVSICTDGTVTLATSLDPALVDFEWTFGITTPTFTVAATGTYWLTVTDGNCSISDTIEVEILDPATVDLGPDISICDNNPVTLDAGPGYTYMWTNFLNTQTIQVDMPGTYGVTVDNGNCTAYDEVNVAILSSTGVDLGGDQDICASSIVLDADIGSNTATYNWSNNESTPSINVTSSGTYSVIVEDGTCVSGDTVTIILQNPPSGNLGPDFNACEGQIITLDAGNSGADFLWNDNSTEQTLDISQSGSYEVEITIGSCTLTDMINVTFVPAPVLDLGPDQDLCIGDIAELNTQINSLNFTWSTGDTSNIINVTNSGDYWVTAQTNGCTLSDTVIVEFHDIPTPDLGPDQTICVEDNMDILLDPGEYSSYNWLPTLQSTPTILVSFADTFSVEVIDSFGCVAKDEIVISPECNAVIHPPTAFSPNGDGVNDIYKPYIKFIENYELRIYNRYGELMFFTNDIDQGWDGKFENVEQPVSVYVFSINYTNQQLENRYFLGNVTLVR